MTFGRQTVAMALCVATGIVVWCAFACAASASSNKTRAAHDPAKSLLSSSFKKGETIADPEALSGLWETPDGNGGVLGIHLAIDTTVSSQATSLQGAEQHWQALTVGVYRRTTTVIQVDDRIYLSADANPGVNLSNGRLSLHSPGRPPSVPAIDLDLHQAAGQRWKGRLHRGAFDKQVILQRPGIGKREPSWADGVWREETAASGFRCLHVAEVKEGNYLGWSDSLLTWGSARVAPGVQRPPYALEHYGELMKVNATSGESVTFDLFAYAAGCCEHHFVGTPEADRNVMRMQGDAESTFRKMADGRCFTP